MAGAPLAHHTLQKVSAWRLGHALPTPSPLWNLAWSLRVLVNAGQGSGHQVSEWAVFTAWDPYWANSTNLTEVTQWFS